MYLVYCVEHSYYSFSSYKEALKVHIWLLANKKHSMLFKLQHSNVSIKENFLYYDTFKQWHEYTAHILTRRERSHTLATLGDDFAEINAMHTAEAPVESTVATTPPLGRFRPAIPPQDTGILNQPIQGNTIAQGREQYNHMMHNLHTFFTNTTNLENNTEIPF